MGDAGGAGGNNMNIKQAKNEVIPVQGCTWIVPDTAGQAETDALNRTAWCRQDTDYGADCKRVQNRSCGIYHHASHAPVSGRTAVYKGA